MQIPSVQACETLQDHYIIINFYLKQLRVPNLIYIFFFLEVGTERSNYLDPTFYFKVKYHLFLGIAILPQSTLSKHLKLI